MLGAGRRGVVAGWQLLARPRGLALGAVPSRRLAHGQLGPNRRRETASGGAGGGQYSSREGHGGTTSRRGSGSRGGRGNQPRVRWWPRGGRKSIERVLEEEGLEQAIREMEKQGATGAIMALLRTCRRKRAASVTSEDLWKIYDRFLAAKKDTAQENVDVMLIKEILLCHLICKHERGSQRAWEELEKRQVKAPPNILSLTAALFGKNPAPAMATRLLDALPPSEADLSRRAEGVEEWRPDLRDVTNMVMGMGRLRYGDGAVELNAYVTERRHELQPDVHLFTSLIVMLSRCNEAEEAMAVLGTMEEAGVAPNVFTLTALFSCLAASRAPMSEFQKVRKLAKTVKGYKSIATCNAMMDYFAVVGDPDRALEILEEHTKRYGAAPNAITFTTALKACRIGGSLKRGREVRSLIERNAAWSPRLCLALLRMYASCDDAFEEAKMFFYRTLDGDLASSAPADSATFSVFISHCTDAKQWEEGETADRRLQKLGIALDTQLANSLIQFYGTRRNKEELRLLEERMQAAGLSLNETLLTSLAIAYTSNGMQKECKDLQTLVKKKLREDGAGLDVKLATALITMYGRSAHCSAVSEFYDLMRALKVPLNEKITVALLKAAGLRLQPDFGAAVLQHAEHSAGSRLTPAVRAAAIEMFGACNRFQAAQDMFQAAIVQRAATPACWTAMIRACAEQRDGAGVVMTFKQMTLAGIKLSPDTLFVVLQALCKCNMCMQACALLESIESEFQIRPSTRHVKYVVAILDSEGRLEKARELEQKWGTRD